MSYNHSQTETVQYLSKNPNQTKAKQLSRKKLTPTLLCRLFSSAIRLKCLSPGTNENEALSKTNEHLQSNQVRSGKRCGSNDPEKVHPNQLGHLTSTLCATLNQH